MTLNNNKFIHNTPNWHITRNLICIIMLEISKDADLETFCITHGVKTKINNKKHQKRHIAINVH